MKELTDIFKALSDKTRLRLFYILNKAKKDVAVCELVDAVEENQYNVSKHLHILESAGMIRENKNGRWVLYSAVKKLPVQLDCIILKLEHSKFSDDFERLNRRLGLRKNGEIVACCVARELMKKGVKKTKGDKK